MAEVGVLNLTIKDNSTSAANGLNKLTDALSRVKTAVQGVDLTPVATSLTKLSATINEAKGTSTTIKNLATLFNAIEKFTKIKNFNIPTEPFKKLRETLGEGFKIGTAGTQLNALREAMTGDWGDGSAIQMMKDLSSVAQSYGDKSQAENIRSMAGAVKEMGDAVKAANKASSAAGDWRMGMSWVKAQAEAVREQVEAAKEWTKLPVNLSQFGRKKDKVIGAEQLQMDFEGLAKEAAFEKMAAAIDEVFSQTTKISESLETVAGGFREATQAEVELIQTTEAGLHKASDAAGELVIRLQEIGDTITSIQTTRFEDMYRMFSELAYDFKWFNKETMRLQSGMQQMLLGAGETPLRLMGDTANMLSTWVDMSAAWQPDWGTGANWKPDWVSVASRNGEGIEGEGWIHPDFDTEAMREYLDLLKEIHAYTTTPSARGTWDDIADGAAQANTQAEAFYHTMERTNEIIRQTAWSAGAMYESFRNAFNAWSDLRSAMSLGSGVSGFLGSGAGQTETGWQQYNPWGGTAETGWTYWKDGAIEVEGTVEDAEAAIGRLTSAATLALPAGEQNVFGSIEEMARHLGITVEEATQKLRETWTMLQKSGGEGMLFSSLEEAAKYYGMTLDELKEKMLASVGNQQTPEAFVNAMEQVARSTDMTANRLDLLREKARLLRQEIESGKTLKGNILDDKAINSRQLQLEAVLRQIEKLEAKAAEASVPKADFRVDYGQELVENLVNQYSNIDLLNMKLGGMKQALADDINANKIDTQQMAERAMAIQNLQQKIDELTAAQERANSLSGRMGTIWSDLKNGIKSMFPTLTGMIKRLGQIAKYRMLRAVLRYITAGFKEGTQNVYEYSKLVGTSLAPAMDSAASSFLQLKNSIGASVAPLIQAFIPVINQVVSVVITAINYLNQFFALLNGQKQWTRALLATTTAFNNQKKAAGGAAAAVKDLLADWDELNIIQSESGGGGGGGSAKAAEDYLNMFEQVGKFNSKIKDIVDFVKDNFDTIMSIVEGIGLAILAWRLSSAFGKDLGLLQKLELMAGLTLMINGVKLTTAAGYDIGENGLNSENLTNALAGILEETLGGGLVGLAFGGITGGIVGLTIGASIGLFLLAGSIQSGHYNSLYGKISEDAETIRKNIERDYLTMEAKATIELIDARIQDTQAAEDKVRDAINKLNNRYGVHVVVTTKEQKDELLSDVETLVTDTNALIQERKENFQKLYVPVSAAFDNADEFRLFSDSAWDGLEEYVTGIGDRIGKMLGNGITEGVELDTLKARLLEISNAILTGQRSGQFTAQVQMAGAGLRANQFANYSRQTIMDYMDQYSQFVEDKRIEALGAASQEYADRSSLVAGLETRYNQLKEDLERGADGVTKAMVEEAEREYKLAQGEFEGFSIEDRASELLKEWIGPGAQLFASDISGAIAMAMSKNKNFGGKRNILDAFIGGKQWITGTDTEVDQYIQGIRDGLLDAARTESGLNEEDMRLLLGITGINPLDLFDDDYAQKVKESIVTKLSQSNMSYEQKRRIAEAYGIDWQPMEEALIEQINESVKNGKEGGTYKPVVESDVPDAISEYYDKVGETQEEVPVTFEIKPIFTMTIDELNEEIKRQVMSAINNDGVFTDEEKKQIVSNIGIDEAYLQKVLNEMTLFKDKNGTYYNGTAPDRISDEVGAYNGNVNILNRPKISPETMRRSGWEINDDEYATLNTNTFALGDTTQNGYEFEFEENAVINITPILADGTVLTRGGLEDYVQQLVDESQATGKPLMELDAEKMNLILSYDVVPEGGDLQKTLDDAVQWAIELHNFQETLFGVSGALKPQFVVGAGYGMTPFTNGNTWQSAVNPNVGGATKVEAEIDGTQMANSVNRGVALPLGQLNATNSTTNSLLAQLVNICSQIARSGGSSTLAKNGSYIRSAVAADGRMTGNTLSL